MKILIIFCVYDLREERLLSRNKFLFTEIKALGIYQWSELRLALTALPGSLSLHCGGCFQDKLALCNQ